MILFPVISDASLNIDKGIEIVSDERIKEAVDLIDLSLYKEAEEILIDLMKRDDPGKKKALFLLGRLYKEKGDFKKAGNYLINAADEYHLLRDYALKMLAEVYIDSEQFKKAIKIVKRIKGRQLMKDTNKMEIKAFLALEMEVEAIDALSRYVRKYTEDKEDLDYKYFLAAFLEKRGENKRAIRYFKEIYINAEPEADNALTELQLLKADTLTMKETLERADNLYVKHEYRMAGPAYKKVLGSAGKKNKTKLLYRIAMSQFRQKKYAESAESFGLLGGPNSMYYRARSFYRIDDEKGFIRAKKEFEKKYPGNKDLALVFLMEAEEFRRQGKVKKAEKSYKKILTDFKMSAEEALWGLGWMYYISGDYKNALPTFSKLISFVKSRDYYKYQYWKARTLEKLSIDCIRAEKVRKKRSAAVECEDNEKYFSTIPSDESYYGYLIKLRFSSQYSPEKIEVTRPEKPEGEEFEKIEALALLGMREEALNEVMVLLKKSRKQSETMYLGHIAMGLGEYRKVIAFAEPKQDRMYLPYSYPLGFWGIINEAADSEKLDSHLIAALIREESRFDPKAFSWAGAFGLMQILPSTAKRLENGTGIRIEDRYDLYDAEKNIFLGTHYLSLLIGEFGEVPFAIAAYNAGERTLRNWITRFDKGDIPEFIENIPYKETRRYVKKVLKSYWQYRTINGHSISGIEKRGTKLAEIK